MKWDADYDTKTFNRLEKLASEHTNFWLYQNGKSYEHIISDYLIHYKSQDDYHRPTVYRRLKRLAAYAYDAAHPGTVWKRFYVQFSLGRKDTGVAYTLTGEGAGEEVATREHLAREWDTTPDMVSFEFTDKKGLAEPLALSC